MATIIDRLRDDLRAITRKCIRDKMPAPKIIRAGICWNLETIDFTYDWTYRNIAAGTEKQYIKQLNMRICKKCEAQAVLVAGEQIDGCWVINKTKIFWLQAI